MSGAPVPTASPEQRRRIAKVAASIMAAIAIGGATAGLGKLTDREEGNRTTAYRDMGGVWTICKGITHAVRPGEVRTEQQCIAANSAEGKRWLAVVDRAFSKPQPDSVRVAFADFAYNVGEHAFLTSTARQLINRGDWVGGCDQLPRWVYVQHRVIAWQVERRGIEQALCRWQLDHPGTLTAAPP